MPRPFTGKGTRQLCNGEKCPTPLCWYNKSIAAFATYNSPADLFARDLCNRGFIPNNCNCQKAGKSNRIALMGTHYFAAMSFPECT